MTVSAPRDGMLFQEYLKETPFWMLVACQLVNLTTFEQAKPALRWLMDNFTPETLACQPEHALHDVMRPLGLWRRRSRTLTAFAQRWRTHLPKTGDDVLKLPGCGKYAADSWRIFIDGNMNVKPDDGKLNWYMERVKNG